MSLSKELEFDLYLSRIKAQSQQKVFEELGTEVCPLCGVREETMRDAITQRLSERTFGMGDGVAIFDLRDPFIKRPVSVIATLEHDVDFKALDDKPVNIIAAILSPQSDGPKHLQRLSVLSRVMRSEKLQEALRDVSSEDEMRALFMPSQDWMVAA